MWKHKPYLGKLSQENLENLGILKAVTGEDQMHLQRLVIEVEVEVF